MNLPLVLFLSRTKAALNKITRDVEANAQITHNLAQLAKGIVYDTDTDDDEAIVKTVPAGAARYAELEKWGGKTTAVDGELISADVSAIKTIGKNLIDPEYILIHKNSNIQICLNTTGATKWGTRDLYLDAGTYTVSVSGDEPINVSGIYVYTVLEDGTVEQLDVKYNAHAFTFTLNSGEYIALDVYDANLQLIAVNAVVQLERSSSATAYAPFRSAIDYTIPAAVRALEGYGWSAGAVANTVEYDAEQEKWFFHKRVEKDHFDSAADFTDCRLSGDGNIVISPVPYDDGANLSTANAYFDDMVLNGAYYRTISVGHTQQEVDAFKEYVDANGFDVLYPLKNEVVTDITDIMAGFDNYLDTEQGGSIEFVQSNTPALPVPSTVNYMIKLEEAI